MNTISYHYYLSPTRLLVGFFISLICAPTIYLACIGELNYYPPAPMIGIEVMAFLIFLFCFLSYFYVRKHPGTIEVNDESVTKSYLWKKGALQINFPEIISLDKTSSGILIYDKEYEKIFINHRSMKKAEFESLYKILEKNFAPIESRFMKHWKRETPYHFKTYIKIKDLKIEYKNLFHMFEDEKEGPFVGTLWFNSQQYARDYFSGPILFHDHYIYLPYFDRIAFMALARIDIENNYTMELIGELQEIICPDHIENNRLYFYNDPYSDNLTYYDLSDQELYYPFTPTTKGIKRSGKNPCNHYFARRYQK